MALSIAIWHFDLQITIEHISYHHALITSLNNDLAKWLKCVLYYCNSNVTATITAIFK